MIEKMKYQSGDIVIKKTGGNKMTVIGAFMKNDKMLYKCYWFGDKTLNDEVFDENDIVSLEEYKLILKLEERADKISQVLKWN